MDRSAFVAAMVSELKTQSIRPGGLAARKPSWERACQDLATDMPEVRAPAPSKAVWSTWY